MIKGSDLEKMSQVARDTYFLREAFKSARDLSQDENTQTGAVIVSPSLEIVSRGANRIHFGWDERYEGIGERILLGRDRKYDDLTHAERDAVYGANRAGIPLAGHTLYATWTPCDFCAEVAGNNDIPRFVVPQITTDWYNEARKDSEGRVNWDKGIKKAVGMLEKKGVDYVCLDIAIGGVEFLFDDKIRRP
ncbi:hypothetical protein HNV12_01675 [Methanococcoides sp. SA1]|nr:hypothetical protein [Methanococcoides sp. SA1]